MSDVGGRGKSVYVFGTCLIDSLFPQAGLCAMRLLREAGVHVIFPQDQTCCGQPAFNSGYRDEARRVARVQLDAFREELPIVVPSASCAGMLRVQYRTLFADTPDQGRAEDLSTRVYELTEYLARVLDWSPKDLGPQTRVVLHNSCSARREMGVSDATLDLLGRLAQVETVEPERATECCGFGGTFAVKQPEMSAAMAGDKVDAILATGADTLLSQDCGCLMNLGGTLARRAALGATESGSVWPRVLHVAEFLWERINSSGESRLDLVEGAGR